MNKPNRLSFVKPEKFPFFYGYIIAGVGALGILASMPGQTVGVSTFTDPVKDALGLNRDQFSNAYMFGTIISSLLLGRAGVWFDKIGARWLSFFATIGLALALFLCASSQVLSEHVKSLINTDHWLVPFFIMGFLFFAIRFTGQGILTMSSRNMIMKWFDVRRGRVNAVRSILTSLGFSASPLWITLLIDERGWQHAWIYMALGLLVFSFIIILFFRDNPENHGLIPDGKGIRKNKKSIPSETRKQFTAKEALKTRAFWSYSMAISFYSFFVTGFTFHVISIFADSGFPKEKAISVFLPASVITVILSLVGNVLADFLKLHFFLVVKLLAGLVTTLGFVLLSEPVGYYLLIAGMGVMGGMFSILNSLTYPRYYGRKHLGAITGKLMSMMVAASALAPSLFSLSFTYFSSYKLIGYLTIALITFISLGAIKAVNPQLNINKN